MNVFEQLRLDERDQKINQVLRLAVKHEQDIAALRAEMTRGFEEVDRRFEQMDRRFEQMDRRFEQLRDDLPDIIAKVAPLLRS